jgi:hypothetical protein
MEKKTINMDESFLKLSGGAGNRKKTQKRNTEKKAQLMQVKDSSVKDLLLKKLRDYRKNKSKKTKISEYSPHNKVRLNPDFMERLRKKKNKTEQNVNMDVWEEPQPVMRPITPVVQLNHVAPQPQPQPQPHIKPMPSSQPQPYVHQHPPPPPYSNMKYTSKPTYRQWRQQEITPPLLPPQPIAPKALNIETKKTFKVGRNKTQKKVGIFLKNNMLKQSMREKQIKWKRTNMKTLKNDLKKRNLIHYGCSAPNDLLRELYESSQACGNIQNQNGKQLVDNYFNETE